MTKLILVVLAVFSVNAAYAGPRKPAAANPGVAQAFQLVKNILNSNAYTNGHDCNVWLIDQTSIAEPYINVIIRNAEGSDEADAVVAQDGSTQAKVSKQSNGSFVISVATQEPSNDDAGQYEKSFVTRSTIKYDAASKTISVGNRARCTLN